MVPIWNNGRGLMVFDTFPKVQVVRKYIIEVTGYVKSYHIASYIITIQI